MATHQRRRGIPAKVWRSVKQVDNRGNIHEVNSTEPPHEVRAWVYHQRSSQAEVTGQMDINILRIGVDANLKDVGTWSRVEILDGSWDIVAPPTYHHGTRNTRHWSLTLRQRPA